MTGQKGGHGCSSERGNIKPPLWWACCSRGLGRIAGDWHMVRCMVLLSQTYDPQTVCSAEP